MAAVPRHKTNLLLPRRLSAFLAACGTTQTSTLCLLARLGTLGSSPCETLVEERRDGYATKAEPHQTRSSNPPRTTSEGYRAF